MGVNNRVGPGVAVIWNPFLLLNFPSQLTDALTACPVGVTPRRVDVDHGSGERMTGDWREVAPEVVVKV